jgi:hypothetical protein
MVMDGSKEQLAPWQILTQMPTGWITRQANWALYSVVKQMLWKEQYVSWSKE